MVDFRDHVAVYNDSATVELTPKIFCEYDKYRDQDICPVCSKKKDCLKVIYGLPMYNAATGGILSNKDEYWIGYCDKDPYCYARWYCVKCKKLF